jgi:DNA-binding transcriptional regulator YbjK
VSVHLRHSNGDTADERIRRSAQQRHELILATLRIIAREGILGVTHRTVTTEANTGHGSVVHHFGSREALIRETMEYLAARTIALMRAHWIRAKQYAHDPAAFADLLCVELMHQLDADPDLCIAVFEFQLAAARDSYLRGVLAAWGRTHTSLAENAMKALGSKDPRADVAALTNALGGLISGQLALPRRDFEDRILFPAVRRLVQAIATG